MRADWYRYIFVGSIESLAPAEKGEKLLTIIPEEVLSGEPANPLMVQTSQGDCLPDLRIGDRWLFYLRQQPGKPIVLDYYGNDSVPVANATKQLELLRELRTMNDRGVLIGNVLRGDYGDRQGVAGANIVAKRQADGLTFTAKSNSAGDYEFPPMPPGTYKVSADAQGDFRSDDSGVTISAGACWDLTLSKGPHAQLAGHIRQANGSPASDIRVVIMRTDESEDNWFTLQTNSAGYFEDNSLRAGKYMVGILLGADANTYGAGTTPPPIASLYYPGVSTRSAATTITLQEDEKRDDIDFVLPTK